MKTKAKQEPSQQRVEELINDLVRPSDDQMAWIWFQAWWKGSGGDPSMLALIQRHAESWGITPMAAVRKALVFIVTQGLWG